VGQQRLIYALRDRRLFTPIDESQASGPPRPGVPGGVTLHGSPLNRFRRPERPTCPAGCMAGDVVMYRKDWILPCDSTSTSMLDRWAFSLPLGSSVIGMLIIAYAALLLARGREDNMGEFLYLLHCCLPQGAMVGCLSDNIASELCWLVFWS